MCCSSRRPDRCSACGRTATTQHYWQVYFDTNRMIREAFGAAGFPAPVPMYTLAGQAPAPPGLTT